MATTDYRLELPTIEWAAHVARLKAEATAGRIEPAEYRWFRSLANLIALGHHQPTLKEIREGADPKVSKATGDRACAKGKRLGLISVDADYNIIHGMPRRTASRYTLLVPTTSLEKTQEIRRVPHEEAPREVPISNLKESAARPCTRARDLAAAIRQEALEGHNDPSLVDKCGPQPPIRTVAEQLAVLAMG
jgi:hypothetical protein